MEKEFKINEFLSLRLEEDKTIIYVEGKRFNQCKFLLLDVSTDQARSFDEIESIDEAAEKLDRSLERGGGSRKIPPETEFWGHCSNIQAWFEHEYNTRLLHRNLAFPLLRRLADCGDPLAKKVFKEEIAKRLESGHSTVVLYLINEKYLSYFTPEELQVLLTKDEIWQGILTTTETIPDSRDKADVFRALVSAIKGTDVIRENFSDLVTVVENMGDDEYKRQAFSTLVSAIEGTAIAKKNCIIEIFKRFADGYADGIIFLVEEGYLKSLNNDDINLLIIEFFKHGNSQALEFLETKGLINLRELSQDESIGFLFDLKYDFRSKMDLREKISIHLDHIRQLKGIARVLLIQRDGNPIQSAGDFFPKDEIFNVSSAASAIFNLGIHLHPNDLKFILIEGKEVRILIVPLNGSIPLPIHPFLRIPLEQQDMIEAKNEYFIIITAQPDTNLGEFFSHANYSLIMINFTLISSGESFKPSLVQVNDEKIQDINRGFDEKENEGFEMQVNSFSLSLSEFISVELRKILNNFSMAVPDMFHAFITLEGGFITSQRINRRSQFYNNLDNISAMSYSLFQTANRCAWLLKKMNAETILLDCENTFQFIYGLGNAIFSTEIGKARQKLGLIRLILPQFSRKISYLIKEFYYVNKEKIQDHKPFDIKTLIGELVIK